MNCIFCELIALHYVCSRVTWTRALSAHLVWRAPQPRRPDVYQLKCGHQVEALFEKHRQRKDKHYRDRYVTGVTPWIVTTYGRIDHLFSLWLRHHSTSVRDYVCSAICAKLLKSRTLRLSAKPF